MDPICLSYYLSLQVCCCSHQEVMGPSRSSTLSQGNVPSLGGSLYQGMFLLLSVVPGRWIVSTDSFLGLNLIMRLSLGSVYATLLLIYGAIFHKQTPRGVFFNGLLPSVLSLKKTHSSLTFAIALLVRRDLRVRLAYQEGRCKGSFWKGFNARSYLWISSALNHAGLVPVGLW